MHLLLLLHTRPGDADQVVTVVVSTNADGCGKDQSAKRQVAQALKGSSKQCSSTCTSTSMQESSELLTNWRKQTPLLFAWLLSSLVAAVFAPLLVPTQPMLLPALTAAALGLVASLVHVFSDHLAATKGGFVGLTLGLSVCVGGGGHEGRLPPHTGGPRSRTPCLLHGVLPTPQHTQCWSCRTRSAS